MYQKPVFVFLIIFLLIAINDIHSQELEIKGFIKDQFGQSLPNINIEILNTQVKTRSNRYGAFRIKTKVSDTIHFHSIQYQSEYWIVGSADGNQVLQIVMRVKNYELPAFRFKRKKSDSLATYYASKMKTDSLLNDFSRYTKFPSRAVMSIENGLVLRGLITQIWYQNSDKGKKMERLKLLYKLYREELKADEKYNTSFIELVCEVDQETANEIKKKCKPKADFINTANEYDLAVYVRNCSKNLKKE